MNVIRWREINKAITTRKYRDAAEEVKAWYTIARRARWGRLQDVQAVFRSADAVNVEAKGTRKVYTVFDILHNRFRLIVGINYKGQRIYFKHLLTHDEYIRGEWKK